MSNSDDRRDDQMRELECRRLASELRQLAKELSPDLKAHCLRMAKQWSDEADERAKDDTGIDRGLG
jgi:DNA-directed RNA polymerase specialized sigma24 family protein